MELIKWDILEQLYEKHRATVTGGGLTILPKIKAEHIKLTSYSKMRVDLAVQVNIMCMILINSLLYRF